MAKAWLESLDSLSDEMKGEYKDNPDKDKGGFILIVEKAAGLELMDPSTLQGSLGDERKLTKEYKAQLANYRDEEGNLIDADAAKDALSKVDNLKDTDTAVAAAVANTEKRLATKHKTDLESREKIIKKRETQLDKEMRRAGALAAIAEHGGNAKLLLPVVLNATEQVEHPESGDMETVVLGEQGEPRMNSEGGRFSQSDFVLELKESGDFDGAFGVTQKVGSGGKGSPGSQTGPSPKKPGTISRRDLSSEDIESLAAGEVTLQE